MGRDGWEVGSSKLGMRRKGEETVCGKDPGIKVTWVVFAGTLGSERHAAHGSRSPQGSLTYLQILCSGVAGSRPSGLYCFFIF